MNSDLSLFFKIGRTLFTAKELDGRWLTENESWALSKGLDISRHEV
ncbi:hypothetical protein [Mycoplasmopsis mustelae]|nr:hypothetical protein [Mycoplasmopsis mustelae]